MIKMQNPSVFPNIQSGSAPMSHMGHRGPAKLFTTAFSPAKRLRSTDFQEAKEPCFGVLGWVRVGYKPFAFSTKYGMIR